MPTFKVSQYVERELTFYVEADDKLDVEDFLDGHPEWKPGDVEGLIDVAGEEEDSGYDIESENKIRAGFRVTAGGSRLVEI